MGNKTTIRLTEDQITALQNLPEQGIGYQIVDIVLNDGKELNNKIVLNSTYLQLEPNEKIDPINIETIRLHEKKKGT
jgi:hypothetical protein